MANKAKDVVYIDVDDEITGVIEKVQASGAKIVALVLPKRAAVFQSIVNMKLLKRTAGNANKSLVLITSEEMILPIAGNVGVHVASTLQSKPYIPETPKALAPSTTVDELEVEAPESTSEKKASGASSVLAGAAAQSSQAQAANTSKIDDEIDIDADDTATTAVAASKSKPKKDKKLAVPNFDSFRKKLLLGGGLLLLLILGWIFANIVLPSARVIVKTDSVDVASSINITSAPDITELSEDRRAVPGTLKELKKTDSQKVAATGTKDLGEKAKGTVSFTARATCSPGSSIPSGTTITSGNFSFITQAAANLRPVDVENGQCVFTSGTVGVIAAEAGDSYNLGARDYSVKGFSGVTGKGSAMSGGVSKIVKIVSQQDIDGAKQKILDSFGTSANQELTDSLSSDGFFPLKETFKSDEALVVADPTVNTEAGEVTVNVTVTYKMSGAKKDDVEKLLESEIKTKIDTTKQTILSNGLDGATVRINDTNDDGRTTFSIDFTATAGAQQDEADIKRSIMGKKRNEVETTIGERPGVKSVEVEYSPFWVNKVPNKESKITIDFQKQGNASESSDE